jgi:PmbA protein
MIERLFGAALREVARRGGGETELCVHRSRMRRFEARGGGIDAIAFSDGTSVGVRVFRDGRMGFSYAFRDDEEEVRRAVEAAFFCAASSDPDPAYGLPDGDGPFPDAPLYDPSWERVGDGEKADFARELEGRSVGFDPRMKRVRTAALTETVAETAVRNSRGLSGTQRVSLYSAHVLSVAEEGGEGQTGYGFAFGRRFSDLRPEAVAEESARRALRMLGARRLPSGRYPAILENEAAADLIEVLVPSFLASNVVKGRSVLAGKVGAVVASPAVTIADDPLDPEGAGSAVFDGEGTPSRRNVLVADGTLRGFLADAFWGRRLGTGSTGSCRRPTPKAPPAVGISNLRMSPGDRTLDALRRDMGSGLLLTEFLGIHTADPVSGDFSVGAAGVRVAGGEEREPVRGFAVSGNLLRLLEQVVRAGSDFRWFGTVGTPSLALEGIDAGGE